MAPRRSADGLLRRSRPSKATTAGVIPVVVVLAIVLGGCGGGSDSSASSTSSSSATVATKSGGGTDNSSPDTPSIPAGKQQVDSASKSSQGKHADPSGSGKQAPRIKQPEGPREPAPTQKEINEATVASMDLSSPALKPGPESASTLPAGYTCDGKNTWPTLRWSGIPSGTAELALLVLNLEPVDEAFFFDWAVTGLDPKSTGLDSGKLPKGAIVGKNSFGRNGYSICSRGGRETYVFALYALPEAIPARRGFDPAALRKRILEVSGNSGLMAVSYG